MRDRVAVITGASRGLGRALAEELSWRGWRLVVDARDGARLRAAVEALPLPRRVTAIAGDVADAAHRRALADAVGELGRLDLLVNNASVLGPSPRPALADLAPDDLAAILAVDAVAPLALAQRLLPHLEAAGGRIVNVTSDAAVEAYAGWGGYGAAKAALDQLSAVLAVEHPGVAVYALDPGDMATALMQEAYPGDDVSGLPAPETVVPAVMRLVEGELPSGRYRAADLRPAAAATA
jgi:NAD(P)-dependent dehydrogenase (short-subunit alcohol dehydrogenase family)